MACRSDANIQATIRQLKRTKVVDVVRPWSFWKSTYSRIIWVKKKTQQTYDEAIVDCHDCVKGSDFNTKDALFAYVWLNHLSDFESSYNPFLSDSSVHRLPTANRGQTIA